MLVGVTGFGSLWRQRQGREDERGRFTQPVYYNTTGVLVDGRVRQRPQICGYARFDSSGGFDPNHPSKMINRIFECAEPCVWMGCNKLLFRQIIHTRDRPECYLVIARFEFTGRMYVGKEGWRSSGSWLIAFSEDAGQQEAMLLLPASGWIRTDLGKFVLKRGNKRPWEVRLVLCTDE